jgi:hypothetical protein
MTWFYISSRNNLGGIMNRDVEAIRSWRDDTRVIFGEPIESDDSRHLCVVKGWWKDVNALLNSLDELSEIKKKEE